MDEFKEKLRSWRVWLLIMAPLMVISGLAFFLGSRPSMHSLYYNYSSSSSSNKSVDGTRNQKSTIRAANASSSYVFSPVRTFSDLQILEAKLQRSRDSIRNASKGDVIAYDPEYIPSDHTYWNPSSFQRSYLEMEKQFKVYVYEEGELPIFHNGPCGSIYSSEGNFIHNIEMSSFRTKNPEEAHVYFLPFSTAMIVRFVNEKELRDHWAPLKRTVKDYVQLIARKYPYWNRSQGSDHFMLACHDWVHFLSVGRFIFYHSFLITSYLTGSRALEISTRAIQQLDPCTVQCQHLRRLSTLQRRIHTRDQPPRRSDGRVNGRAAALFAGGLHGPIRPVILRHWEGKERDVRVHRYLPKGVSYYEMMRKSKFCLCPSGYEVASPRIVESLYTGCVPVIIKDHYVVPFSDVLNWKSFAVEVSVGDVPKLKEILEGISTAEYLRLQRNGGVVRRHFEVNLPPKRYDVFHMMLHSIWLRRLNIRVRGVQDSS